MDWQSFKQKKLRGYRKAKLRGEVDRDIISLLDFINSMPDFVTLSSCSGRIALIDSPEFGDKKEAVFLGKWHEPAEVGEVKKAAMLGRRETWLIQYPPILHVSCRDMRSAEKLLVTANNSGFRRSGLISLKNLVVEISSLERIELPLALNGKIIVDDHYLGLTVDLANKKLLRGKERLKKLEENLRSNF
jgi:tRNA wybutosine-synthesizing protein 3